MKKSKFGYVYIIKCCSFYKIGITKNIKDRIRNYDTHNPKKTEYVHFEFFDDSEEVEKILFDIFQDKRIKGEWFKLKREDVLEAISIMKLLKK